MEWGMTICQVDVTDIRSGCLCLDGKLGTH
jgi:hypothetical protein